MHHDHDVSPPHGDSARITPRARRRRRRVLVAVAVLVVGIGAPLVVYETSVQPGAALVAAVFDRGRDVTPPPDYPQIAARVTETRGVAVDVARTPRSTVDVYRPILPGPQPRPVVLWVHGGGFISGTSENVHDFAVMVADQGYVVASLDYSLAPGARYPTPVLQGLAALQMLHDRAATWGGDATRLYVGGDSAGAQIASQLAAVTTNAELAHAMAVGDTVPVADLRGVVLFCGLYDMGTVAATHFPALRTYLWSYTGVRTWTQFADIDQLSTTLQVTAAYPPTYLTVGGADPFRTQAAELEHRLESVGVPTSTNLATSELAHLGHEYQFDFDLHQAVENFAATMRFLAAPARPVANP